MALWMWLCNPDNQQTLAFIGTGIVGLIGVLSQMGRCKREKPTPVIAPVAAPATTSVNQTAEAHDGGTAFNVSGNGNTINGPSRP